MKLAIIGSGYLVFCIEFSKYFNVTCFDINKDRIQELKKDRSNQQHQKKWNLKKIIFTPMNQ